MIGFASLVVAFVLVVIGSWIASRGAGADRPTVAERVWFHAVVTWPIAVKAALGSLIFAVGADEGNASYTLVTFGPAILMSVVILVQRLTSHRVVIYTPALVFALVPLLFVPRVLFSTENATILLPLVFLFPVLVARAEPLPVSAWFATARTSLVLVIASVVAVGVIAPANVLGSCRIDKCSFAGEVLTSPITNNGNFAGVALAIVLPLALAQQRRFAVFCMGIGSLIFIELSGSRAALAGAVVVVLITFLFARSAKAGPRAAGFALAVAFAATVVTALVPFPREFATFRGGLWAQGRELAESSPLLGRGPSFWSSQADSTGFIANYSPHNFWLEIAVAGGLVAVVLVLVAAFLLVRTLEPSDRFPVVLLILALLIIGVLEAPVQPGKIGLAPFAHLIPLMLGSSAFLNRSRTATEVKSLSRSPSERELVV